MKWSPKIEERSGKLKKLKTATRYSKTTTGDLCIIQKDVAIYKFQLWFSKTIMVKKKKTTTFQSIDLSFWKKLPTALVPYYHSGTVSLTAIPALLPEHQSHHLLSEQQQFLTPAASLTTLSNSPIPATKTTKPKQLAYEFYPYIPCPRSSYPHTHPPALPICPPLCAGHCAGHDCSSPHLQQFSNGERSPALSLPYRTVLTTPKHRPIMKWAFLLSKLQSTSHKTICI